MSFQFSRKSLNKMGGIHPDLKRLCMEVIAHSPIDFGIISGIRTDLEQAKLWAQGRTLPGKIVTWVQKSKHQIQPDGYGHAIDFACYMDGVITWSNKYYYEVADEFKRQSKLLNIPIVSGVDWKVQDSGHIELK